MPSERGPFSPPHPVPSTNNQPLLTNGQSVTVAQLAAGALKFRPIANDFGVNAARSFTFQVQDDANINTPAGGANLELAANAHVMSVNINAVNDHITSSDA